MMWHSGARRRFSLTIPLAVLFGFGAFVRAQEPVGDTHTFSGPNGATLEAEVLDLKDGKVLIRRLSDSQEFALPANRLAPPDVEFMRAWLAARLDRVVLEQALNTAGLCSCWRRCCPPRRSRPAAY